MPPPLAIFYHPDGYDTVDYPLVGRRAAGKTFLQAWIERRSREGLHCYAASRRDFDRFCEIARNLGATCDAEWIARANPEKLGKVGALYFPGPDIGREAWRRYRHGPADWSLIGVTHTICTDKVMDGFSEWLTAPVESWDAVICTSTAVKDSIERQLAAQREFLTRRLGASAFTAPQLPIVPLGVPTDEFAPDDNLRAAFRAARGIADDDPVALFVGRLSVHGKAHPVPMFIALEKAARASGKTVHFLLVGWFANEKTEEAFRRAAAFWCPGVKIHAVDGLDAAQRAGAWRAGDVFISLVDNIQETFGLTPVEAMASGLPAVVSDWDGYRETVRDGIDGFLIPTLAPAGDIGETIIDRYAAGLDSYDQYLARAAAMVAVDVEAAAGALTRLFTDPDLRARMGAAGRKRAADHFDWRVVLDAYEEIVANLSERRRLAVVEPSARRPWPSRLSPFEMFATYPSRAFAPTDVLTLLRADYRSALAEIAQTEKLALVAPVSFHDRARTLLEIVEKNAAISVADCIGRARVHEATALVTLLTLAKFGLVSVAPGKNIDAPR